MIVLCPLEWRKVIGLHCDCFVSSWMPKSDWSKLSQPHNLISLKRFHYFHLLCIIVNQQEIIIYLLCFFPDVQEKLFQCQRLLTEYQSQLLSKQNQLNSSIHDIQEVSLIYFLLFHLISIVAYFDIVPLKMHWDKWFMILRYWPQARQTPAQNLSPTMISPYTVGNL